MAATPAPAAGQMSVPFSVKPPRLYRSTGRCRNSSSTRITPRTSIQFTMFANRKSKSPPPQLADGALGLGAFAEDGVGAHERDARLARAGPRPAR